MDVYANWLLPTYCMFTVRQIDILNSTAVITRRMIEEFRCADCWIGIARHGYIERLLNGELILEMTPLCAAGAHGLATEPMR